MARGSLSALDGDRRQHLLVNPAIELSDGPQVLQSLDQDSRERDTPGLRVWQLRGRSGHPGAAGACPHLWVAIEIQHRLRRAGCQSVDKLQSTVNGTRVLNELLVRLDS